MTSEPIDAEPVPVHHSIPGDDLWATAYKNRYGKWFGVVHHSEQAARKRAENPAVLLFRLRVTDKSQEPR